MASDCKHPTCFDSPFCRRVKKVKKIYRLRPFSKKRADINKVYSVEAKKFREENPLCRINSPVCIINTQGVHHVKGKATVQLLMDKKFWKPSCNPCNGYIEDHSQWAQENGHKIPDY